MFVITNAACTLATTREQLTEIDKSQSDRVVTKTCTFSPIAPPRLDHRRPSYVYDGIGAVNNIGMENNGYLFYKEFSFNKPFVISIAGTFEELKKILQDADSKADFYEINISCPNIEIDLVKLKDLENLFEICGGPKKIGIKMFPCFTLAEVRNCTEILNNLPISYIVCCNTMPKGILFQDDKPCIGALSGKYVQPVSLWNVKTFREHMRSDISVYGCGGICTKEDVIKYKNVGANGVQVATAFIEKGPLIFQELC